MNGRLLVVVAAAFLGVAALPPAPLTGPPTLATVEQAYADASDLRSQVDVTRYRGAELNSNGIALTELRRQYASARSRLVSLLGEVAAPAEGGDDGRALDRMRTVLENDLTEDPKPAEGAIVPADSPCDYEPERLASEPAGIDGLWQRAYACYSRAAQSLPFEGRTLDRGTVNERLTRATDPAERRRLFLAQRPLWKAIDGEGGRTSPYRTLARLSAGRWHVEKTTADGGLAALGVPPAQAESWLTSVLTEWSERAPAAPIEPWDFSYRMGSASRALSPGLTAARLTEANAAFYRSLGADPAVLGIRYDVEPRPGRPPQPYAFTTFGRASREVAGVWRPGELWVFATYRGGFDDLAELLHETGHGIHIAAIRTRPAFADWPDSDIFTEALADFLGAEAYEPEWQQRFLGQSVAPRECLRARYSGVVMDMAWALLEVRMRREPTADPNEIWTDLTSRYLHIVPHPELSWWATRGQLIETPGYMMNYAAGAIVVADLRARTRALRGPFTKADPGWYPWLSDRLYRFGRERSSQRVVEDFLGRPVSSQALLAEIARLGPARAGGSPRGGR